MISAMNAGPNGTTEAPSRLLPGLGRPVSRVILGMSAPAADLPALWDRYVELGGNAFDTARWYPDEVGLGRWLAQRPDRDDLVIVGKGAHPAYQEGPPRVHPSEFEADLLESLERLGRDRIDVFLLHRDDETVPVGEIMTALARHRAAGRIGATGGSNWTTERLAEANAWAVAHGVPPFDASSPNLALACPVRAPWPGCVTAGDTPSMAWYERTKLPLISWSPLARGYFADPIAVVDEAPAATAAFDSPANRARRARAQRLAVDLGATANQVALAWLLNQPFPTWATIGATTIPQLDESMAAAALSLTGEQVRWLTTGETQ
jgi:aryl-alcohol dehydrogenase-like predicted oxidoreductase